MSGFGLERQRQIFLDGLRGQKPAIPIQPAALEEGARRVMTPEGFAYVAGGAGAEVTLRANRAAFERCAIVPRVLRDVATRDATVELFGRRLPAPLLLKGILHPDDARRALDAGVDGLVVSNHGGRQVDGAIATLDALPAVVEAVGGRVPVLLDSGVRTGADVFKALALGAAAVCIGRPYVYGLAVAGEAGVAAVIENLLADFDLTLALAGCRTVREIGREMVTRVN